LFGGHVARKGDEKCIQYFGWKGKEGKVRDHLKGLCVDEKIILQWILGWEDVA
jgi:hypothetical protein